MRIIEQSNQILVDCENVLDINTLDHQVSILMQILTISNKKIIFNANTLNRIDTAALQTFLSFSKSAEKENISWEWKEPSFALLYTAKLLGMKEVLKL